MHNPDQKRPQMPIELLLAKQPVHAGQGCFIRCMRMRFRAMSVRMAVNVVAVTMVVRMTGGNSAFYFGDGSRRAQERKHIHDSENDQHQGHGELHAEPDPGWNHDAEENDCSADDKNRQRVSQPPESACQSGAADLFLTAADW